MPETKPRQLKRESERHMDRATDAFVVALIWIPVAGAFMTWGGWPALLMFAFGVFVAGGLDLWRAWKAIKKETDVPDPEPWEILRDAQSVTALGCECESRPNEYRGRDGYWHCFNCDGRVERVDA